MNKGESGEMVEKEIDIKKLLEVIKRRFWIVILMAITFTIAGGAYTHYYKTPLYESSTRIIIHADSNLMNTLTVMVKEPVILKHVVNELDLQTSPESLSGKISVSTVDNSQIVKIKVVDTNSSRAAEIANATANVYKREVPKLLNFEDISILSEAKEQHWPINQSHSRLLIIGFIFGIIVGVGIVFLLDSLDDKVRSPREIEKSLNLPVLGSVSKMNNKNTGLKKEKQMSLNVRGESIGR